MFVDDTSLFSIVHDAKTPAYKLNRNLQKIPEWAYQWKIPFHLELNKPAQEVIFSRKTAKSSHPLIYFNNVPVSCGSFQIKLGVYLDEILNFSYYIKEKISKAMKGIGAIKKLSNMLP